MKNIESIENKGNEEGYDDLVDLNMLNSSPESQEGINDLPPVPPELDKHDGKFVLVKDGTIVKICKSFADAVKDGKIRFDTHGFSVHWVKNF